MSRQFQLLKNQNIQLGVDANFGAHIMEFSLHGKNALSTQGPEIGSTYWPSPEHFWGWPPPKALDKSPYRVEASGDELLLTSEPCPQTQLVVHKHFQLHPMGMVVSYSMRNVADKVQSFAPWEITRISGGVTFYQSNKTPLEKTNANFIQSNGCVWHEYNVAAQAGENQKLFGFGSTGWVANANNGLLLVKSFKPLKTKDAAPEEAEVEIYAHGEADKPYIEMEQQGVYKKLNPGDETTWTVNWLVSELPPEIELKAGNEALTDAVLQLFENATGVLSKD